MGVTVTKVKRFGSVLKNKQLVETLIFSDFNIAN